MVERLKFYWSEHEKAAHSMSSSVNPCPPNYAASYTADVVRMNLMHILGPDVEVWKWSTEYVAASRSTLGAFTVHTNGYARTKEAGRLAAENACNRVHAAFLPEVTSK